MHSIMQSKSYVDNSQRLFKGQLVKPNSKALFLLIYSYPEMISRSIFFPQNVTLGNAKYLFVFLISIVTIIGWFLYCFHDLFIRSSIWSIFTDWSWYFGIFIFEATFLKKIYIFLFKIKSCLTNVCLLKFKLFSQKRGSVEFGKVLYQ